MDQTANPWNERYSVDEYVYGTEPNDFLRASAHILPPASCVLCIADGEGRNGVFLAEQGHDVTSVDASAVGLAKAERLARERGVELTTICADLAEFELGDARWDAVVSIFCHLPPSVRRNLHQRIVRSLTPNGLIVLEAYAPDQLAMGTGGPPSVERLMTGNLLTDEFRGLDVVLCEERQRVIHEGILHNGRSAVVNFIGRKG